MSAVPSPAALLRRGRRLLSEGGQRSRRRRVDWNSPGRVTVAGFAGIAVVGTVLLSLPVATTTGEHAPFLIAIFTAVSAVCVNGLAAVDTGAHWSTFGEVVILVLIQVGGLGIMTAASLLGLLLSRRLGFRTQLLTQAETKALTVGDVRGVVRRIAVFSACSELVVAVVLTLRLVLAYGRPLGEAAYEGAFHSVSAFNNAGFALYGDSLVRYVEDPWVCVPVALAVVVGGLGFPVVFELARSWRHPGGWTVLTRITVLATVVLLVLGTLILYATERTNAATLGGLSSGGKVLSAWFLSVMSRSGGYNSIDIGAMNPESLFVVDVLMLIGGGSAGTAGGIKVTTFGILGYVLWSEVRGEPDTNVGRRRVPAANQRQALAVALTAVGIVTASTFVMLVLTPFTFEQVLFETISAFANVGMSTGVTPEMPPAASVLLVVLMFAGRVGPVTLATALALRSSARRYRLPEEPVVIG